MAKKSESDPKRHFYFCGCDRFTGGDSDRDHLYLDESDDPSASGAAGNDSGDAGISFYVFIGFFATFLYNYVANVLRGIGNSVTPLFFLGISVILNIFLDLYFVLVLHMGIKGAAVATVIAQYVSGVGILLYFLVRYPEYHISRKDMKWNRENLKQIMSLSGFTCLQQSVMNFGILVVQGIVNSFGATVMAAFAVAVKTRSHICRSVISEMHFPSLLPRTTEPERKNVSVRGSASQ